MEWIVSHKEIVASIVSVLAALYTVANFVHNLSYQEKCEKFYGIPGKYFHSIIGDRVVYLVSILLLIIVGAIIPLIMRKNEEKSKVKKRGETATVLIVTVLMGMVIGFLNLYSLLEIMKQTHKTYNWIRNINIILDENSTVTIGVVVLTGIISLFGITFIDKFGEIRRIWIRKVVGIVFDISFVMSLELLIFGMLFVLTRSVEDKTKYEVVTIDEVEYVVLSECDDKILVVLYEVENKGHYIFDTSRYWFYEKNQGTYRYINLEDCPEIKKE